jgi:CubicO group peptidase (beta-lactamase class C family)
MILQLVIEETTGKPFAAAMKELVLDPVGMTHSTFDADPGSDNVARAHAADGSVVPGGWYIVAEKSIGGLWSTPGDLAKLLAQLIAASNGATGKILSPATMKTMLTGVTSGMPSSSGLIALGLFVSKPEMPGEPWFTHNGHNPGYHASLTSAPTVKKGLVMVANREGSNIGGEVMSGVAKLYEFPASSGFIAPPMKQVSTTREELAQCAGTYQDWGFHAEIRADGDKLYGKMGNEPDEKQLYPVGPYRFIEPYQGAMVEFTVEQQKVKSIKTKGPIGQHEAVRVP